MIKQGGKAEAVVDVIKNDQHHAQDDSIFLAADWIPEEKWLKNNNMGQ
jgi:hypothetical protein